MSVVSKLKLSVRSKAARYASVSLKKGKPTVYVDAESTTRFSFKAKNGGLEIAFASPGAWGTHSFSRSEASRLITELLAAMELDSVAMTEVLS